MSKSIRVRDEDHVELRIRAAITGKDVPAIINDFLVSNPRKKV